MVGLRVALAPTLDRVEPDHQAGLVSSQFPSSSDGEGLDRQAGRESKHHHPDATIELDLRAELVYHHRHQQQGGFHQYPPCPMLHLVVVIDRTVRLVRGLEAVHSVARGETTP